MARFKHEAARLGKRRAAARSRVARGGPAKIAARGRPCRQADESGPENPANSDAHLKNGRLARHVHYGNTRNDFSHREPPAP
jgi:hypothetical protein